MTGHGDHRTAADDAYEAARRLAHATIRFDHPEDPYDGTQQRPEYPDETYGVLGNVLAVLRSLHQVVQQVEACQHRSIARATGIDHAPATGRELTAAAHAHLRDAIFAIDRAHARLDRALGATSAIIWQLSTPTTPPRRDRVPLPPAALTDDPPALYGTADVRHAAAEGPGL
ncbi:hypothetical protein [Myceligenerans xiligouense]|uniref:Uncharacterized protein n=1 Tax=Myceligenerans xiligouense TaxID=253184 RepID=A0A3N4ZKI7_9MICO|nr:hypothetical protein [Myceligenerans xiligouense]RPF21445.1 hypothetical protein EDD34_2073 [Myceligenerans xiligouense]